MGITYDTTGITIQTLSEILDEREANLQTFLGTDFTISGDNAIANLQLADADREFELQELLLYIAMQLDPDQAEGIWLDFICALNNITRYSPEKTLIPLTITGTPNVSKNAGTIIVVDEDTDEYFTNVSAFTVGVGGTISVSFQATSFGDISASSGHTYSLKTASSGISSVAWDGTGTYAIGRYAETDIELRARREYILELAASSTLASIRANVSNVDGVTYLQSYENDTMSEVDTIPAKAFEIVVSGGDDTEIATAILEKKPVGIQAYGTSTETILDENGNSFTVGFTRPTDVPISLLLNLRVTSIQSEEWISEVKNHIVDEFTKDISVGEYVYPYGFYLYLGSFEEIINPETLQIKKVSDESFGYFIFIDKREVATLSINNITITQTT